MNFKTYYLKESNKPTCIINSNGDKHWYLNDELHREDGPAVEDVDGYKAWLLNGKLHREDGPAREWANGTKEWYLNGKIHREDGPAIEYANGDKFWYLNDKEYSETEYKRELIRKGINKDPSLSDIMDAI